MVDQGMDAMLMSGDALVTDEYWQITGDAGAGTLMTFSPDPRKNPIAKPVVEAFRRRRHRAAEGYVALHLRRRPGLGAAAATGRHRRLRAGGRRARRRHLRHRPRHVKFDAKGDVSLPGYVFYEWKNGTYDYLN